ncbi:conserved Plasmodium protein, unknown function [Plasmodium knowlesi strain H]|uniref:Protein YIPF n=3 Tax=Plasmodium knowlesi TaxID=5850 RepID=A0A5E7X1A3_PLAKH|nr:protein YIPF6, putative [Plasmodium knowlesi strain H]OTN65159.1 Protein YIPF [Plasmodium knowlesi]CAA9988490.1 protein YIPF6, putative [Plasmodium knowlesi strain H]SBO19717.1 conserved Plasmodium protein, unknown function [Plasmodium knowlesi strain H]SBO20495.1 conserved Plasmodium protein, unknown function [Plasmodium knowlesi strain H]VVS77964.1 protein YIPF6, putative [Plasmodium knowlesi strain H]
MVATVPHFTNYEFTMDEPVKDTVIRDVKSVYKKILHICFHQYDDDNTVKKWDLWGSFIVYITLSIIIFLDKEISDKKNTFAYFFFSFILGHILVSLNLSLLHTNIHFFQILCIISYAQFPLVFSSIVNLLVPCQMLRLLFSLWSIVWSTYNCILILAKFIKKNRMLICFVPICLLQFFVATFFLIK